MCGFDNRVFQELREEMREEGNILTIAIDGSVPADQRSFRNPQLRHILLGLFREAKMANGSDPMLLESIIQDLLDRLLILTHSVVKSRLALGVLHTRFLRLLLMAIW